MTVAYLDLVDFVNDAAASDHRLVNSAHRGLQERVACRGVCLVASHQLV